MKSRLFIVLSLLVISLTLNGCARQSQTDEAMLTEPSAKVQELIDKFQLEVVDYAYVKKAIGNATRAGSPALLLDARPHAKYLKGTIPSSLNIPDNKIPEYIGQLADVPKNREIIVFCGGWGCVKTAKLASYLKKNGYTNVKIYQAGEPEWKTKSYIEVSRSVVESILEKDSALLMDARPRTRFLAETIPGSLYMNNKELERLSGRYPADKSTPIVIFCGGYACNKSHLVAEDLLAKGYGNVRVYAAGLPDWKKAGLRTTKGGKAPEKAAAAPKEAVFVDGIKAGVDEGTVDGEWLYGLLKGNKLPETAALIDVRGAADYKMGHIKGARNVTAEDLEVEKIMEMLPEGKVIIFYCASGARAMEARMKLEDARKDVSRVMYFDANISCKGEKCEIEVNEPLG